MTRIVWLSLAVCLLCACGRARADRTEAVNDGAPVAMEERSRSAGDKDAPAGPSTPELAAAVEPRLRVKTGAMTLIVTDIKSAEEAASGLCARFGGYVALSRVISPSGTLTLKVPAERFDAFVADTEKLGRLKNKEISTEDVSERYYDLETRVANKRILLARYQDYLKRAGNTRELIDLEREINNVTTEIESLEGSFRTLKNSVAYSTLHLALTLAPEVRSGLEPPSLAAGLRAAGDFTLGYLYYFFLVILYMLIVGVPLLLAAALVYFVGFGRLGLIVKLFRALSPRKKT